MNTFQKLSLLAVVTFFAPLAHSHTIVAHRVEIRLKQVTENMTGASMGLLLGLDTATHGQIVFLDERGQLAARPFPIHMQLLSFGATVIGTADNNQTMRLRNTNGKRVEDLLGRYWGGRLAAALFTDYVSNRNTALMNRNHVVLLDHARTSGLGIDASGVHQYLTGERFTEESNLGGDWNSEIQLR